ncbi:MAG: ABC transporter permease [Omnitrophica WOR_2 bacterium]
MHELFAKIIRSSAFFRKEVNEILRQPRLVLTLVLGPFLILLVFGIGYINEPENLRTLFVADPNSQLYKQIQQYASQLGPQLIYMGITSSQEEALNRLRRGEVDLVAVAPNDAYNTIRSNQQAVFTMYHRAIDPTEVSYITYFGQYYVDIVNRRILQTVTAQGQTDAATLQKDIKAAKTSAAALHSALQSNDANAASQSQQQLNQNVDTVSLAMGATLGLLSNVQQTVGSGPDSNTNQLSNSLASIQNNNEQLNSGNAGDNNAKIQRVSQIEQDLNTIDSQLSDFRNIDPAIIVNPFRSDPKTIAPILPNATDFFAPAVLALLLQHLAVTFAALSIVKERTGGTMELFRVSPLTSGEALFGKYISYLVFGGIIGALLTLLLIYGLHLPMLGSWGYYVLVVFGLLFTSLGIGFIISIISQTDSQAVQYSMIILLTSVFFSGFLMSLNMLRAPVQIISWLLPVTYGSTLLRDITLRGIDPGWIYLAGLFGLGLVLMLIAWWLMHRLISRIQG